MDIKVSGPIQRSCKAIQHDGLELQEARTAADTSNAQLSGNDQHAYTKKQRLVSRAQCQLMKLMHYLRPGVG